MEKDLQDKPLSAEAVAAIEDILVKLLDDQDETSMSRGGFGVKALHNPSLCDLAAEALAGRWKQPKLFDIHGPFQVRERERTAVKNEWLKKRGMEAIAVPPPRRIAPAPKEQVEPLLKAVLDSKADAERKRAMEALERLGLSALPAVQMQLGSLKSDHTAYSDFQRLAARLGLIVTETRFSSDSVEPQDALRRKVEGLKGNPITEASFLELLKGTAASLPKGVRGVKLVMERIPDGSGVCLVVTLIADRPPRPDLSPQVSHGSRVVVGKQTFGSGVSVMAGFGGTKVGLADIDWSGLTKNLRTALAAPSDEYWFVQAQCSEAR
ncbi:MAG TPA: hypothetical protein VE988_26095 [Gemmataceae bacterium]|nr:hypothetical protein [Gemmataceae bacterium]